MKTAEDIREHIRKNRTPVRVVLPDGTLAKAVGENPGSIVFEFDDGMKEVQDADLDPIIEECEPETPRRNVIIHASERDDWPDELEPRKRGAVSVLSRLSEARPETLPRHPVVLMFRVSEIAGARARTEGAEITVHDHDDPVGAALREIAGIVWRSLPGGERTAWAGLHRSGGGTVMASRPSDVDSPENCFRTAQTACWRGRILDSGYREILDAMWPEAGALLDQVHERARRDMTAERRWEESESELLRAVSAAEAGARPLFDGVHVLPPSRCRIVARNGSRAWGEVIGGALSGKVLPLLKAGRIDSRYIRRNGEIAFRVPRGDALVKAEARGKLYVDLDGVLADIWAGADVIGIHDLDDGPGMWKKINSTPGFWENLPVIKGAKKFWDSIKKHDPIVLTSNDVGDPAAMEDCAEQKRRWVGKRLGKSVRIIVDKDKSKHAGPGDVLIDDMEKNTGPWGEAGGTAILHKNFSETQKKLRDLGL